MLARQALRRPCSAQISVSLSFGQIIEPLTELPSLSKSLRNVRDRLARDSWLFEDLGFVGLCDGCHVHMIASHPGISRQQLGERLWRLWPGLALEDAPDVPMTELSPHMLVH